MVWSGACGWGRPLRPRVVEQPIHGGTHRRGREVAHHLVPDRTVPIDDERGRDPRNAAERPPVLLCRSSDRVGDVVLVEEVSDGRASTHVSGETQDDDTLGVLVFVKGLKQFLI